MAELVFRFPAPDLPLSENASRRMHWAARKRNLRPWQEWAERRWIQLRNTPEGKAVYHQPAEVLVWIPFLNRRRRDPHNFVSTIVKSIVDGLTDQHEKVGKQMVKTFDGIWPDDTPDWVTIREPRLYLGEDCVVVILPKLGHQPGEPPEATRP